jgi:hypothetical protein
MHFLICCRDIRKTISHIFSIMMSLTSDPTTTEDKKQTNPTNHQNGHSSDTIPITPAVLPQCDSSNTNPTCVAATNELIKEQTELEKQRMLIAQQQQEQNEISLENQCVIDNINAAKSQDTSSSDNGGSSSSSTSNGEVTEEEDKHDIQIDDKSHYAIAQIPEGFGLYKISSNEKTLSDSIQTIRPMKIYDLVGEAMADITR